MSEAEFLSDNDVVLYAEHQTFGPSVGIVAKHDKYGYHIKAWNHNRYGWCQIPPGNQPCLLSRANKPRPHPEPEPVFASYLAAILTGEIRDA